MPFPIENIQDLCDKHGETFKSLETMFGFSNSTIKRWGKAKKIPPYDRVKMISDYFGVSISEMSNGLFEDSPADNKKTATNNGDGNSDVRNYINSMLDQMDFGFQIRAANELQSLLQQQLDRDAQKESD